MKARKQLLGDIVVKEIVNEFRSGKTMGSMARDILELLSRIVVIAPPSIAGRQAVSNLKSWMQSGLDFFPGMRVRK